MNDTGGLPGREIKVGLAVIGCLAVALGVVVARKLLRSETAPPAYLQGGVPPQTEPAEPPAAAARPRVLPPHARYEGGAAFIEAARPVSDRTPLQQPTAQDQGEERPSFMPRSPAASDWPQREAPSLPPRPQGENLPTEAPHLQGTGRGRIRDAPLEGLASASLPSDLRADATDSGGLPELPQPGAASRRFPGPALPAELLVPGEDQQAETMSTGQRSSVEANPPLPFPVLTPPGQPLAERIPAAEALAENQFPPVPPSSSLLEETIADSPGSGDASPFAEPKPPPIAAAEMSDATSHVVRHGESLSSIAEQRYGDQSYSLALAAANRDRLQNPHQLPVGQTLVTPPRQHLHAEHSQLCPPRRSSEAVAAWAVQLASAVEPGRRYLVEEGDSLWEIAYYELGNSARWAEIYALNHGTIGGEPDHLRVGTWLVLPREATEEFEGAPGGDVRTASSAAR